MAIGKISVKLTPNQTKINNADVVTSFGVLLVGNGPASSAITDQPQDGVIELFEESDKANPIATWSAPIKLVNKDIQFDADGASISSKVSDTDFSITAVFNKASFKNDSGFSPTLKLPWKVPKPASVEKQSIGAQLKIAGVVEVAAFSKPADKLDIPLKFAKVPDDGTNTAIENTCFGAGVIYPQDNNLLGAKETVARGAMEVWLHSSVRALCDGLNAGDFDPTAIQTHLNTIFSSVRFSFTVKEPTAAELNAWTFVAALRELWSKTVPTPPTIPNSGAGHKEPFFRFIFSGTTTGSPGGTELASAEILEPPRVQAAAKTKNIVRANSLGSPTFGTTFNNASTKDDRNRMVACVIAHEIGHDLGLRHGLAVSSAGFAETATIGLMTGLVADTAIQLKQPGPVHEAELKKRYP